MSKLLAKAKLSSLSRPNLQALIKADEDTVFEQVLLQGHNTIEGSYEEFEDAVRAAFRAWRIHDETDYAYRWSYILGIFTDRIVFCCDNYYSDSTNYGSVAYSVGAGNVVTIDAASCQPCDVTMVVREVGIAADADGDIDVANQSETEGTTATMATKIEQAGDAITNTDHAITADAAGAKGVTHSDGNPSVVAPTTAAESGGVSGIEGGLAGTQATGVELSGDEGASTEAPDGSNSSAVKDALADTSAGTKTTAGSGNYGTIDGIAKPAQSAAPAATDKPGLIQSSSRDIHKDSISFIQSATKPDKDDPSKKMVIQGIATRADIVNSEGQVYPLSVWQSNLDRMNQECDNGKFIGKLEHPEAEQGLVDTALKFNKFWLQGSDLWFEAVVVQTEPYGKNLQAMIEAGVQVDFSSRGYGTFLQGDWRGTKRSIVQDDFTCVGFDAVWYGASTGSTTKSVAYQSQTGAPAAQGATQSSTEGDSNNMATTADDTIIQSAKDRAATINGAAEFTQTKKNLLGDAAPKLSELGQRALTVALDSVEQGNLTALFAKHDGMLDTLQATFPAPTEDETRATQSATYSPTFYTKQSKEQLAPKTVGEMFDRMVEDLPEGHVVQGVPNHFTSPRAACKRLMTNIANERQGAFNGRNAALGLLALEQGALSQAQDILTQSLATGSTIANGNANNDGAPLSAPLIFPLIRRVFPMYIMNEIASIQPMDRPDGKIFYLDGYRTTGADDDAGTGEKRIDLNTSANPFNSSYADNNTEGAAAQIIRLRLASVSVHANTKKLGAQWSIEEMQDLRAYHGLDAAQELMGAVAREMALEWNQVVLNDMLAQATASARTFGSVAPGSGNTFNDQKSWDEYIWTYIAAMDNDIFAKRNGPMTHLVVGVDAALQLAKSYRVTATIGGENGGSMAEIFPGTTYFGDVTSPGGGRYKIWKTNFWGQGTSNGSKIMGLRKGTEWSDTPYIFSPYTDYVTPLLTDPSDFSQKQGVVSRAANKVVVSDAIGYLTVSGATGALL